MSMQQPNRTGVVLHTGFFPLMWILFFVKTNVNVDGVENVLPWGDNFFPLPPGPHTVTVSVRYLLWREMGKNSITVDVREGQTTQVRFRSPLLVFLKGKLTQQP